MVLCKWLFVWVDWACPLKDVLCACPLSLLILRSGVLIRTLSHIWWRLYLRTLGERYKEPLNEPSPIHGCSIQAGHSTNPEIFTIIGRKDHSLSRTIKESIYIRVNDLTFNRNVGKYNLHHKWDRVHFNTPDLKICNENGHAHRTSFSGHDQSIPTKSHLVRTIGHTGHAQTSEHAHRTS